MNNLKKIEEYLDKDIPYIDRNSSYKMIEIYRKDLEKYETITKFPMWIGFKVTSKCNFKCIHCWVQRRENEPSFEEIIVALDKLKKMSVMHITITGGEPFLRKDILEILREVKKRRFNLEVFTNASLLNKKIISEIADIIDINNDLFQVSFDASNENIFMKQRLSTNYEHIIDNIKLLIEYGIKVRLNFTATHLNQYDIIDSYKKAIELKVLMFSISHVYDLNNGSTLYDLVDKEAFLKQVEECITLSQNSSTKFRVFIPLEYYSLKAIERKNPNNDMIKRNYIQDWFIHSDGSIYPDVTTEYDDFYLGNIYKDNIEIILNNVDKKIDILCYRDLTGSKCEKCSEYKNCEGGDKGRAYKEFHNVNKPDPRCIAFNDNHDKR